MTVWEYKVVPAPRRGVKAKGAKTAEDRFAHALQEAMNALGAEGWDYVRADTLPCDERQGLTGRTTVYHNMLVFRRPVATAAPAPDRSPPPMPVLAVPKPPPIPVPVAPPVAPGPAAPVVPPLGPATRHPDDA